MNDFWIFRTFFVIYYCVMHLKFCFDWEGIVIIGAAEMPMQQALLLAPIITSLCIT